ncbi:MAG: hypothetical protein D6677_11065 [Calditrichaeota bacterium]|nr:MAG: hypothetical protein D6677_11065 [Calditrichota bacterium]
MLSNFHRLFRKGAGLLALGGLVLFSCQNEPTSVNIDPVTHTSTRTQTLNGGTLIEGTQNSGAIYKIWVPDQWNRELVMFAHGYVDATQPVGIPESQLYADDSTYLPDVITDMGYAFAITSYSVNGLAVKEGVADLADLTNIFKSEVGRAKQTYLIGVSEGGLITNLSMEKNFFLYSGALSLCGPSGDFVKQLNYFGDFRVLFDYFFPDVLPGNAVDIPQELMDNWDMYQQKIIDAVIADPIAASQVLRFSGAPIDPQDPANSTVYTFVSILWYNAFATNNARQVLGGNPFDNSTRTYHGGFNAKAVNAGVQRFTADAAALQAIENDYTTSGLLFKPLVMMHTLGDQIVPKEQMDLYEAKAELSGSSAFLTTQATPRYGHCNFTADELMAAFSVLVYKVTGELPGNALPANRVFLSRK